MDDTAVKSLNGEASTPFASTFGIHCEHDGIPSVTASKRILIWFLSPSSRRSLDLIFPTPSANYTCIKMIDGKVGVTQLIRPLALTSCSCGLQILWSILLSSGTPFLISVGFDGASTALVWGIAPICGTFVQPWFGALSDRHRWRKRGRQAFLTGGAVATSITLVGFSLSRTQVLWIAQYFDEPLADQMVRACIQLNSITWFSLLNIAIQPLQMASRAIIIENNDTSGQVAASAWASRMQGIGSILGFLLGSIPLSKVLPPGLAAEFSILCLLGSVLLLTTAVISAYAIEEDLGSVVPSSHCNTKTATSQPRGFIEGITNIPREVWQIFAVQFFAWLGWFPFRTYYTSWLANAYATNTHWQSATTDVQLDLQSHTSRLGSIAGLYLSITAFVANCALPLITSLLDKVLNDNDNDNDNETTQPLWKHSKTPTKAILQVWIASHVYSAFALFFAGAVGSQIGVILAISSLGLSWAVTLWVPFCLIGLVMSRQREEGLNSGAFEGHQPPQMGTIVGFHNAAISAPQILSALICSVLFTASSDAAEGTLLILLSGGCWTLVAAFALWIFFDDLQHI